MVRVLGRVLPIVEFLSRYDRAKARGDLVAGLTVAVLLVPQAMAYAMLAGLDPVIGLYASTLPLFAYALFGSSPHLAVGPVALVSLVVADALVPLAEPGSAAYLQYAIMLAAMIGVLQIAMALLRLGFVVDFLSHPVIVGFAAAAALIIVASQVEAAAGIELVTTHRIDHILLDLWTNFESIHGPTLLLFAGTLAGLLVLKWRAPRVPRALVAVLVTTGLVWALDLRSYGVAVVGDIPSGFPELTMPSVSFETLQALLPASLIALLVGFMEAFSVAKVLARGSKEVRVGPNRELLGLGVANLASTAVGGYAVGGALSRTTVAHTSGARTPVSGVVAGLVVIATVMFLTPAFRLLPTGALSAVIVAAVVSLVDVAELKRLYRVDRRDFVLAVLTIVATLVLGTLWGVLVGVGASVLVFLARVARPTIIRLQRRDGRDGGGWFPDEDEASHDDDTVVVLQVQAPAFFANARYLQEQIRRRLAADEKGRIRAIIVDAAAIDHLDASAEMALHELHDELCDQGVELHFARLTDAVRATLERSGLAERLGNRVHVELDVALSEARRRAHRPTTPTPTPQPAT